MSSSSISLEQTDLLYRFLHLSCFDEDGKLTSNAFSLRGDPEASVGIAKMIQPSQFEAFCALKPGQGLAQIKVEDVTLNKIGVQPQKEIAWGIFAEAHAILTGYAGWTNNKKTDAARALRDAANRGILRRPT